MKSIATSAIGLLFCSSAFAETHVVEAYSMTFVPDVVTVVPGDVIRWEYVNGYPHDVTSGTKCMDDGYLFLDIPDFPGGYVEWTVPEDAPSEIPYFCQLHCGNGMTGMVNVEGDSNAESVLSFGYWEIAADGSGWADVQWSSDETIAGFQFDVGGVTLTSVDGGLTETLGWLMTHNESRVIGVAILPGSYIPPQPAPVHLLTLHFENVGEVISFAEVIFADDQANMIKVDASDTIIISPACPADINGDGVVDVVDLLEVVGSWGESGGPSDINGDGVVNVSDLLEIVDAWGSC